MLDGVVAFDLERYPEVPGALGRRAVDAIAVAARLDGLDDPTACAAAGALRSTAAWLDQESSRARSRWEAIRSIPLIDGIGAVDHYPRQRRWLEADWYPDDHDGLQSYEQLVAFALWARGRHLVSAIRDGRSIERGDVDAVFAALARVGDAETAAHLMELFGAEGIRDLAGALAQTAHDGHDPGEVERYGDGMGTLLGLAGLAAIRLPDGDDGRGGRGPTVDDVIDAAQTSLSASASGVDVAAGVARMTRSSPATIEMLEVLARRFAVAGLVSVLVDVVQHGPFSDETIENVLVSGMGLAGTLASGVAGAAVAVGGLLLWLALSAGPGRPAPRTWPTDHANPGGQHWLWTVNGAGVPVAPDGI